MKRKYYIYLSSAKYDVLKYIASFIKEYQYSPTYLEIGMNFNYSRARAGAVVRELFLIGLISKGYSAHRNIRMTENQINVVPNLKYNREYEIND